MGDPRVEKLADVIVSYSVAVRPGDKVVIEGESLAEPLLKTLYVKVLQAGGHPLMRVTSGHGGSPLPCASDERLRMSPSR
jgi:aminopeptidase